MEAAAAAAAGPGARENGSAGTGVGSAATGPHQGTQPLLFDIFKPLPVVRDDKVCGDVENVDIFYGYMYVV